MKNYLIIVLLFAFILCDSQKIKTSDSKMRIFDCILNSKGVSENFKNFINSLKNAKKHIPIVSPEMKPEEKDLEIFRACKKQILEQFKINKA